MNTVNTSNTIKEFSFSSLFELSIKTLKQSSLPVLIVFLIFYLLADTVLKAYTPYPWIDIPAHITGGMAICYFFYRLSVNIQELIGKIPKLSIYVMSIGLTVIIAVFWECFEYLSDAKFGTTTSLGLKDTLSDILNGLLGSIISCLILWNRNRLLNN
jgi:hypothetical protein